MKEKRGIMSVMACTDLEGDIEAKLKKTTRRGGRDRERRQLQADVGPAK